MISHRVLPFLAGCVLGSVFIVLAIATSSLVFDLPSHPIETSFDLLTWVLPGAIIVGFVTARLWRKSKARDANAEAAPPQARSRWPLVMGAAGLFVCTAPVLLYFIFWAYVSLPVAHLTLANGRRCTLEYHRWSTGASVLSCYENDARVGAVNLHTDILNYPVACFPGLDGKSVICLSYLDTFEAAFVVDFSTRTSSATPIPARLQISGEEAVNQSDFKIRACTRDEADRTIAFIKSTDSGRLSSLSRWHSPNPEIRESLLTLFLWATGPRTSTDPVLKNAKPALPLEE